MSALREVTLQFFSHSLAVMALVIFVLPFDASSTDDRFHFVSDWSQDSHASEDHHDHDDKAFPQGHCDPGPDCSNSYAVFNAISMTVAAPVFHRLIGSVVSLSSGRITLRDIPPPKRIS